MKAEVLRAARERPGSPDARDLTMRGWAILWNFNSANKITWNEAIAMFERAIALDPKNVSAMTGLATALFARPYGGWSDDPAGDLARADSTADAALSLRPDDSEAHFVKALLFERKSQMRAAIAEAETAVADDPNNARAIAMATYYRMFLGHAEDGVAGQETALRLSPHDPMAPIWQVHLCYLHNHLAQWEQAIEWCEKALANNVKERAEALAALALANAWAGHDTEAKKAVAELRKVDPRFTVQRVAGQHLSDDPTFNAQRERVVEGLRKAGLPEGPAKTN
jgi:tetratricopeptide (TPR) repeat protein